MQVIVALPEDFSLKREASIELSRARISVTLSGVPVLSGALAHEIDPDRSDWVVEDELDGFDGPRFLVIDLRKRESFVDWSAPLAPDGGGGSATRRLVIGGKGEAQKRATGQQCATAHPTPRRAALCLPSVAGAPLLRLPHLRTDPLLTLFHFSGRLASYQILQMLPSTVRTDVYARAPPDAAAAAEGEPAEMRLHFVGKVVAEGSAEAPAAATQAAALAAQEVIARS